ncbi:Hypothetical protein PHPALM_8565 [Phytophthora palmivora]|uniref:Uncharacterized protein n=1 Tax=Phytophthora palmivora TaxID=4796 RepID=A0A2P4Y9I7_9STRA|nr:Hypothetical protein PHPALM_8565 [Phytophthora palmivora]
MGLDEFKPGNTKRVKNAAISVFKEFLKSEHVEFDYVKQCIEEDATAIQYFRQSKMWLFELFPVQRHIVEAKVLCMGKALDSFCMKRDGKVFFVRFIRMKTSEEQGLSLFPDADFVTCPFHAIAMALITQAAPSAALIDNLPEVLAAAAPNLVPSTQLLREDHKVSKTLRGYDTQTKVKVLSLKLFDAETQDKIAGAQCFLFATGFKVKSSKCNLSQQRMDWVFVGWRRLLLKLERLWLSRWRGHHILLSVKTQNKKHKANREQAIASTNKPNNESKIINHQLSVIDRLMEHIDGQDERMDNLEAKIDGTTSDNKSKKRQQEPSHEQNKPKRRRGSLTHLHTTWFARYAQEPRWFAGALKRERSNSKQLVVPMKLFVADDLKYDPDAGDYRDRVLELGRKAEAAVLAFLSDRAIKSRGSTTVRKYLQELYASGSLNDLVAKHLRLCQCAAFNDPDRQDQLEPAHAKIM